MRSGSDAGASSQGSLAAKGLDIQDTKARPEAKRQVLSYQGPWRVTQSH